MTPLNEAGLSAAEAVLTATGLHSRSTPSLATQVIVAYLREAHTEDSMEGVVGPQRRKMPTDRIGVTHKFEIDGHEGYITANFFEPDKAPETTGDREQVGEIFLTGIGKDGSTIFGLMQVMAVLFSICLQFGVPLEMLCLKLAHMKFEPKGQTTNPQIPVVASIPDYIVRWLAMNYGSTELNDTLNDLRGGDGSKRE